MTDLRTLIPLLASALILASCGGEEAPEREKPLPPARVRVQEDALKKRPAAEEVVGTVRARLRATIEAKLSGRILELPVTAGDRVRKGNLLVRLDAREVQARLEQARARLEQAGRDRRRLANLLKRHAVTRSRYDDAEAAYRVARAAVEEAETMLDHATVAAPFDGVVSAKLADVGDLAAPGKPLLVVEDPAALQVEAFVSEALIGRLHTGDTLNVTAAGLPASLPATVAEIAPAADPATRTFRVKLDLPRSSRLRIGQFVRVAVPVGEVTAPHVPAAAVVVRGQLEMVFVVEDARAHMRLVKTGKHTGNDLEILSGLEGGERVAVDGAATLVDGQPVEVR